MVMKYIADAPEHGKRLFIAMELKVKCLEFYNQMELLEQVCRNEGGPGEMLRLMKCLTRDKEAFTIAIMDDIERLTREYMAEIWKHEKEAERLKS
jgi:hypothetical protein